MIVDAESYFALAKSAMEQARHSIVLVGWDFDLRIKLTPGRDGSDENDQLGRFLRSILARRPGLRIFILKWDMAVVYTLAGQLLPLSLLRWGSPERLHLRFDSTHPWTSAHHQKIAVIDDSLAFCGGIDMTTDRWDTRGHCPSDPRRKRPDKTSYGPWHDATVAVDGQAAQALGFWARCRWKLATGETLDPPPSQRNLWPEGLEPQLRDVEVGIARTMPRYDGRPAIREIEKLYVAAIESARRSIYIESQYFASVQICDAIAKRLREPDGPEVVVINPETAEGWLEEETMGSARAVCLRRVSEADRHGRFRIFYPVNKAEQPIYVHAKILVIDDRLIRVGSSNINNRSLGFDSECDLAVEAAGSEGDVQRAAIRAMRDDLLAEHLGTTSDAVAAATRATGSLIAAIDTLIKRTGRSLRPLDWTPANDFEEAIVISRLADPERPKRIETRVTHLAKRMVLKIPPAAVGAAVGFVSGLALALTFRRSRRRHRRGAQEYRVRARPRTASGMHVTDRR